MPEENNKQNIEIAQLRTDVSWIKEEISCIKKAVYNDIPHQISDLKKEFTCGLIIGVVGVLIIQILSKFF